MVISLVTIDVTPQEKTFAVKAIAPSPTFVNVVAKPVVGEKETMPVPGVTAQVFVALHACPDKE